MENNVIKSGCFHIARQIFGGELWRFKPSTWLKVWVYIFGNVNYKKDRLFDRGEGFFNFSKELHNIGCDVTYNNVCSALEYLKSAEMITARKTTRGIIIKVLNYERFQTLDNYKTETKTESSAEREPKQNRNRTEMIDKKVKKEKKGKNSLRGAEPPGEPSPEGETSGSIKIGGTDGATQNPEFVNGVSSAEIQEVLNVFYYEAKANNVPFNFGDKRYRRAAEELILAHGADHVVAVAQEAIRLRKTEQFVPSIVNPLDLKEKWLKLAAYAQKKAIEETNKKQWVFIAE